MNTLKSIIASYPWSTLTPSQSWKEFDLEFTTNPETKWAYIISWTEEDLRIIVNNILVRDAELKIPKQENNWFYSYLKG